MTLTSGFYNSQNGDRRYSAEDFGRIFNGIITDGVFAAIGSKMFVRAVSGMRIAVGSGRAWIDGTWVNNDTDFNLQLANGASVGDRIDMVVLEVNREDNVRAASIKVISGTASSSPTDPTLENSGRTIQKPLAKIYVVQGASTINQARITNLTGTNVFPYVTSPVKDLSLDVWTQQFEEWFNGVKGTVGSDAVAKVDQLGKKVDAFDNRVTVLENRQYSERPWKMGFVHIMDNANTSTKISYSGDAQLFHTPASKNGPGSWAIWPWLQEVRPYIVGTDGRARARLNPNNYEYTDNGLYRRLDERSGEGVYIWIPKIFYKNTASNNSRAVEFSNVKADSTWNDDPFRRASNEVLEGMWIPMFYMDDRGTSLSSRAPYYNVSLDDMWRKAKSWSNRQVLFGGPMYYLLRDIITMLGRTMDSQAAFGQGLRQQSKKNDEVVGGGMFYGTDNNTTTFNKILHSNVLGSMTYCLWDPYCIALNRKYLMSEYYQYNATGSGYIDTGLIDGPKGIPYQLQSIMGNKYFHTKFSSVNATNFNNGAADISIPTDKAEISFAIRMGGFNTAAENGINLIDYRWTQAYKAADTCSAAMLFPPAGYTPYNL